MGGASVIGLEIAKNAFQVRGINESGAVEAQGIAGAKWLKSVIANAVDGRIPPLVRWILKKIVILCVLK